MHELSQKEYWSGLYEKAPTPAEVWRPRWLLRSYADVLLWDHLIASVVPAGKKLKAIELGSAPGSNLIRLHHQFGCEVYGAEYTESGVAQNRALFAAHGIDAGHVIHADVFDEGFLERHQGSFDVVISQGFIEHFDDPARAVAVHVALAAQHGVLIVAIPNVTGLNGVLGRFFNYASYAIHNVAIMQLEIFRGLFERPDVRPLYCGYCGTFSTHIFNAKAGTVRRAVLLMANVLNMPVQLLWRNVLRGRRLESGMTSPYLVFIGRVER